MTRKDFFKKLGAGAIVAAVAPKVLAHSPEKKFIAGCDPAVPGGDITVINTALIPDSMTPEEWLKTYKETGMFVYSCQSPYINDIVYVKEYSGFWFVESIDEYGRFWLLPLDLTNCNGVARLILSPIVFESKEAFVVKRSEELLKFIKFTHNL